MARWAKSLNQKKDYSRIPASNELNGMQNGAAAAAASADIGFAVLEKKVTSPVIMSSQPIMPTTSQKPETLHNLKVNRSDA